MVAGLHVKSETCMKRDYKPHLKMLTDFQLHERESVFPLLEYSIDLALLFLSVVCLIEELIFYLDHRSEKSICFSSFDYFQQATS